MKLFEDFAGLEKNPKDFYVYSTTSAALNEAIFDASYDASKKTNWKFHHIYEATS